MNVQTIELSLLATLIVFMYKVPRFLLSGIRDPIAKILSIGKIMFMYRHYGLNSGILSALIFICLLHYSYNGVEGFTEIKNEKGEEEEEEQMENTLDSETNITENDRKVKENAEKAKVEAKRGQRFNFLK